MRLLFCIAVVLPQILCLHRRLSKRELQSVFGVDEVHHVPEYTVIKTERIREDGGKLRLRFDAWNTTYDLDLKPNRRIISPHIVTVIRDEYNETRHEGIPLDTNCHYQGRVISHADAPVAISDCRHLMGTLVLDEHFLVLQTVPDRHRRDTDAEHLVFKRAASLLTPFEQSFHDIAEEIRVNEIDDGFCDLTDDLLQLNYTVPSEAQLGSPFIFPQLDPITLEIGLFLDSKLYEHFQREFTREAEQHLLDFSLALINNVHVLYQQPTLSPNLDIVIVRYELWKTQPRNLATALHKNGQAQSLLDGFCRHQSAINPGSDLTDTGHWDHGVLLTGYDIYHTTASVAGVAPVARMCDPLFACSLVEGLHLGRSFVLAHEMGHNMGMVHDGVQNQCGRSCCLMSAVNGAGKTTWSECSVREFNAFLMQLDESGRGNCLRDPSPGLSTVNHLSDGRLPGQRFTADQQCSYFWGRDYQVEIPAGRNMDDICRILWCGNSGSTISTAHPALEGSWCGGQRWCIEGRCRSWPHGTPPQVIDGGWSQWSSGEKLCPVAQCQITGSIQLKSQHRACIQPAPNNGGLPCTGSSIRGLVCGNPKSNCKGLSRDDFANRVCRNIKHDPIKPDTQLTGESFDHSTQPCKVWCHLVDSELIRNKGQYPDGSPCGRGKYCIGGSCLAMSCAGKAVVETASDCPARDHLLGDPHGEWSPWSECSASCGPNGRQIRRRECKPGHQCTVLAEERACDSAPACPAVSEWTDWTECDRECGGGRRRRERTCLQPACNHVLQQAQPCNEGPCWREWSPWSVCSATCGGGSRSRSRECVAAVAAHCEGDVTETEECNAKKCVVEAWGDWLPCSVSCGVGFQIRERLCDGILCETANRQARTCNEHPCSSTPAYSWSSWTGWSPCSSTCGQGQQTRSRECETGECPSKQLSEERRCVLRPCPSWTDWQAWSECLTCDSSETSTRRRFCTASQMDDSQPIECEGAGEERRGCDETCRLDGGGKRKKAHGNRVRPVTEGAEWAEWNEWTQCSATCDGGERKRSRICLSGRCPPTQFESQREECGTDACEKDPNFSAWSAWTPCPSGCGEGGSQTRTRRCTAFFFFQCLAPTRQERRCERPEHCRVRERDAANQASEKLVPVWSSWSDWSACSCYTLTASRRRFCTIRDPALQGFCSGSIIETRGCQPSQCAPQPGAWSEWAEWSRCSKDCQGTGHQIRNRMCADPLPENRGSYCAGYSFEQRACVSREPCGVRRDGGWEVWSEWGQCSHPCKNGQRSRTRYCDSPRPQAGGTPCFGADFELQPCRDEAKCRAISTALSTDPEWTSWSSWSECPDQCGFALQSRQRTCSAPVGQQCTGSAHETTMCYADDCEQSEDGEWAEWAEWSSCVDNCGTGLRTRIRSCIGPVDGGSPCLGRASEAEACDSDLPVCSKFQLNTVRVDELLQ